MLLKEIVGKYEDGGYSIESGTDADWWCSKNTLKILRRFFHVPWGVEKLWIQFHNRPASQRVKCSVVKERDRFGDFCYSLRGPGFTVDWPQLDDIISPWTGKTIYVEVWYKD